MKYPPSISSTQLQRGLLTEVERGGAGLGE